MISLVRFLKVDKEICKQTVNSRVLVSADFETLLISPQLVVSSVR